eukprot:SAG31_NODE_23192_length_509_cov_0.880488_1_plen_25_part_10
MPPPIQLYILDVASKRQLDIFAALF